MSLLSYWKAIDATFRGDRVWLRAGQVIQIPANAPHQFRNNSAHPARLLCICSPAGQEGMFRELGVEVPTRTTVPSKPEPGAQESLKAKALALALAPKYETDFVDSSKPSI